MYTQDNFRMVNIIMSEFTKYILTLDVGKDSVKAMGIEHGAKIESLEEVKRVCFKTRTYDLKKGYIDVQGNSHKVEFNGEELIVGEQGNDRSFNTSKTEPLHQISAYTAITQFLEPNTKSNKIDVTLACPITVLRSEKAKQEYKDLIKGNGPINITVNDKKYEFEIDNVLLKAEGSGILYLAPELFRNKKVAIVDFGGLNMSVTLLTNGTCVNPEKDRFAEEFGSIELINAIANDLTAYKGGNIVSFADAERALEVGHIKNYGKPDKTSAQIIEKTKAKFFKEACTKIASRGINISYLDTIIFVGGTTMNFHDLVSELPNGYVTDNSQWATTEGLFKVALKKYNK